MECRDAQVYLRFRRPGFDDLGPEVTADLDRHLAACPLCAAESRTASAIDAAFASAMRNVVVPTGLRERLVVNLSAQRGTTLRKRAYRGLAVAASLLLAVGLGFGVVAATRPQLDVYGLTEANAARAAQPRKAVQEWLRDQNLPQELPYAFNYDLLVTFGTEPVQGRDVPVVVFRAPAGPPVDGVGHAKVYIFREGTDFKLTKLQDAQNSHCQAQVLRDPVRFPGVVYVVLYTNELRLFMQTGAII
jgi:hypothetical protein